MRAILQNLADATDAMNQTIRENRDVIHETLAQHRPHHRRTASRRSRRSSRTSASITEDVKQLDGRADGKDGRAGRAPATRSSASTARRKSLESALEHIDNVAGRIDRGEGTIGG